VQLATKAPYNECLTLASSIWESAFPLRLAQSKRSFR